jgi:hypothetical protein
MTPATGMQSTAVTPATGMQAKAVTPATGMQATAVTPATGMQATAGKPDNLSVKGTDFFLFLEHAIQFLLGIFKEFLLRLVLYYI